MGQSDHSFGDRPEAVGPQCVHCQAAQRGQDVNAIGLTVAVRVFPELSDTAPVPGIFDGPPVAYVLQQWLCRGPETRDLMMGFVDELALADTLAARSQDLGAARPVLHPPTLVPACRVGTR